MSAGIYDIDAAALLLRGFYVPKRKSDGIRNDYRKEFKQFDMDLLSERSGGFDVTVRPKDHTNGYVCMQILRLSELDMLLEMIGRKSSA